MIPNKIIELAVEGGWDPWSYGFSDGKVKDGQFFLDGNKLVLNCKVHNPQGYPKTEGPWYPAREFWVHLTQVALDESFWRGLEARLDWPASFQEGDINWVAPWLHYALHFSKMTLKKESSESFLLWWDSVLQAAKTLK